MINTLTLNPAVDKILYLDTVKKNVTNRVKRHQSTIGGKGTHVSMNLSRMGRDNRAFGIVRGRTGQYITTTLREWGVDTRFVEGAKGESRTNYILIEGDNSCTTIAEKGEELTDRELQQIVESLRDSMGQGEYLVLSGDASNYPDPFVYNTIAGQLAEKQPRLVVDASGPTLRKALECRPFLIKPNKDELEELCGFTVHGEEDVLRGMQSLDRYGIEILAVSLGREGAIVRFGQAIYKTSPPDVEVRNTAGCGDSFLAALLHGYEDGMGPEEMLRFATAVSSATAASALSVGYDSKLAEALLGQCGVSRLQ